MSKTLADLGLVPSANVILSETDPSAAMSAASSRGGPYGSSSSSSGGGWLSNTWSAVSGFVWNFLSAPSAPSSEAAAQEGDEPSQQQPQGAPTSGSPSLTATRIGGASNVHGLQGSAGASQSDSKKKDDDKLYWNGNSTQFG